MKSRNAPPKIVLRRGDLNKLTQMANGWLSIKPELADALLLKLGRAKLADWSGDTVQIGSTLVYASDGGPQKRVKLVYPDQADISIGAISVLTPIGSSLLGLAVGDTVAFEGNDGRQRMLTVIDVVAAEDLAA